ncbi:helix-turn-helix domain-containing protein [Vibrio sp. V27_P1S3P104]|nr:MULTISPECIES: AraC family transcriptional regulator [Vibrio]NAW68254.1 helix-turn-helix domain-containing protein [Vibrio sp. V28_P6S34P95]NAX05829.1 helix-turn-helix domain-containing protein [Vibrio sp. V30_P3S12P165]NAX34672.1 helix-turn-helix domain-containing protein [Vibrio sp. V29_P1S30P107]NAX37322.1 helix-turn-helix domain-containing protein [Vibrio sp. V27_P1S3P104]NAX40617.1 helix-turn-helix domain-containing protein [Vibrio sp. V26_P1S5P106]
MIIIRMYVKLRAIEKKVEQIMQNRTSVMENKHRPAQQVIRQTITLARHVITDQDEVIIAQQSNQPVIARGRFIEYTSPSGFTLHGGCSHELIDCDVVTTSAPALVIILLMEGTLSFAYDDLKFNLSANVEPQALMVNVLQPCIFHRRLHQDMQVRKLTITLPQDKLQPFAVQECPLHHFIQQDKVFTHLMLATDSWQTVANLLNKPESQTLSWHITREAMSWRLIQDVMLQCSLATVDHRSALPRDEPTESVIDDVLHYIDQHLYDELSLAKLADQHAMSVSTLQRKFKYRLNMTMAHYIRHRRLQFARQKLERGLVTITEAAYEAGYLHPSNFTAAFKKAFGSSPQVFLEQTPFSTR